MGRRRGSLPGEAADLHPLQLRRSRGLDLIPLRRRFWVHVLGDTGVRHFFFPHHLFYGSVYDIRRFNLDKNIYVNFTVKDFKHLIKRKNKIIGDNNLFIDLVKFNVNDDVNNLINSFIKKPYLNVLNNRKDFFLIDLEYNDAFICESEEEAWAQLWRYGNKNIVPN